VRNGDKCESNCSRGRPTSPAHAEARHARRRIQSMADVVGWLGQELRDPVPDIALLRSAGSATVHAHLGDPQYFGTLPSTELVADPLMSLLHNQRVHDDKAWRCLQRKDLHMESTVTLRTRTFVPVLPRLLFR